MTIYDKENVREYKPVFNDDRDYTTNAPTYYDYMAEVNTSVHKALEDIEGIVEGDIVDYVESENHQLLQVTKKRVDGKHVGYTLTPIDPDNNITTTDPGIEIVKVDNHTFSITTTRDVVKQYLVDGNGAYITWVGNQGRLNIDFSKVQAKLTFQDGIKLSGTTVSADWNKVQKVLTPDNKSIFIDENGRVTAQVPYDRLESKVDKWRTVGNVAGSIFEIGGDAQPTTVNPAFLKKSGVYFYLSRSKSDNAIWGGTADTPTSTPGIIKVTSSNYNEFVLQEFYSMDGKNYFFRIGSNENMLGDTIHHSFWSPWRAVFNQRMYDHGKFGDGKGKYWGQDSLDENLNYNAGSGTQREIGNILAGDLTTIFTTTEKYSQSKKRMTDVIRFAYEGGSVAGDCNTGSNVYYRVNSVNTVTQKCKVTAHNAVNGTPITQWEIEHPFFAYPIQDMTAGNDRLYFINKYKIFWFSLNDYSTGYVDFSIGSDEYKNADGTESVYKKYTHPKGISYYNDKLYVLVQEDYKRIANDHNLGRDVLRFAVWEITLNNNGTGRVSDKCLFKDTLSGVDMHYLQVINNNIYVGFNLDRLYNASAQNAYGGATTQNKYDPCGIGTLTYSMRGLLHEQCENVKDGLEITGLGHVYAPVRQAESATELNADGCIVAYNDMLLVSGYKELVYNGVYSIAPYVNTWLPTASFDKASKISYNSDGEAIVTSQVKDEETGQFVNVQTTTKAIQVEERTSNPIVLD